MFSKPTLSAAARYLTALFLLCAATQSVVAQTFSFSRLLLGAGGPTNRIFTAGDVVTPLAQLDSNVWYKVIVRDGAGNVLNPSFPCVAGTAFATTNSYVIQPGDPPSTNAPYTFVIEEFANGACSGAAMASKTQQFYVVTATAYTSSALTSVTNRFTTTQAAYVRMDGLPPSSSDWNVTWFLPSGSNSCANTSSSDRPDSTAAGRLPSTYLAYPPSSSFSDNWNKAANYDGGGGCDSFSSANEGQWQLTLQFNTTNFVTLRPFVMSNDCFAPTVDLTDQTVCSGTPTTFTAITNGTGPLTFVWRKDGVVIPVTSRSFTISPVTVSTAGVYTVEVTGPCGRATNSATLTVNTLITSQPLPDQAVCVGEVVNFLAVTNGTGPFSFQWRKGTTNLAGATAATFTISNPATTNSGNYNVVISGSCNSVTNSGKLTVYPTLTLSPMTNAVRHVGTIASFSTAASGGNGTNLYSWWKDGALLPGQTNRTLVLTNLAVGDSGTYTIIANGSCIATQSATLLVAYCFNSLDVMLVIDRSGSMVGQPYADARTAATNFIRHLLLGTNSDFVGLVSFNPTATLNQTLTNSTQALEGAVNVLGPATNGTCVSCGVSTAQTELNSIRHRSGAVPIILVLTDGVPHDFDTPSNALYHASVAKNSGTRVFTVGLNDGSGTNVDQTLLSDMSSSSNDFFYAQSSAQLATIFDQISSIVCRGQNDIVGPSPTNATVCAGVDVEFTVTASGCANFNFQWSKEGTLLPGETNRTLSLPNVSPSDAGVYSVVISSFCGTVTNSATLTVNTSAQIIFGALSQTRCAGGSASFTISAAGTGLTYQWWHEATPLPGQTNTTLTLTNVAPADAGFYYAVVSSPCGVPVSTSTYLTVNTLPALTPMANVAACPGQIVTFQTTASGTGPFSYVWRKNGATISGATSSALTLAPATVLSVATYSVEVTGTCGTTTNSASLSLLTNTTATPLANLTRCVGEAASFATVPGGSGPFTFVWRKDGVVVPGQSGSSLIFSSVALTDAGTYSVEVSGACKSATNSATLVVNALTTASSMTNVAACGGNSVSFATTPQGTGPFSFAWRKNGVLLSGATNAALALSNVSAADAGSYAVEVAGLCNSVTNIATLNVLQNTTASTLSNATRCVGESVSFTTTPAGTGPFNFVWRKSGVVMTNITNATLSFVSVTTNDSGVYSVEITGVCNAVTNSASLFVNEPTTASPLANTTVCSGESVSFTAVPQGTGPFTFIWRKDGAAINGATNASLIFNAAVGDSATYAVEVTGMCNSVTNSATLLVRALTTAVALYDYTRCAGESISFTAMPSGTGPFTCVWRKDGIVLPGETNVALSRSNLTTTHAGVYSVEINGACNSVTNSAALVVNELTTATLLTNQIVCAGDVVSLSTIAHGTGPFSFVWRKQGVIIEEATDPSLTISNATLADSGTYSVQIFGRCNSVTNSVLLTVRALTTATPLLDATRCAGEQVSFTTTAGGSGPFVYAWRKNGLVIAGETNALLSFASVTTNDGGIYAVEVTGACNSITNTAALIVNEPTTASPLGDVVACAGDTISFATFPQGTGPFSFLWRKDGQIIGTNSELIFTNATMTNSGVYGVEVSGVCNSVTNSAILTVRALTTATPMTDATRCVGESVSFSTIASGTGPFTVVWRKDGVVMSGETNSSLSLPAVTTNSAGVYAVEVVGACNAVTNSAALIVHETAVATPLADTTRCIGDVAVFSTTPSGTGPFVFAWRKDGALLANETNASLSLTVGSTNDAGLFTVEVSGACGSVTNRAALAVNVMTMADPLPDQAHCAGQDAVFTAIATGTGPFTYTWRKDGAPIPQASGDTLSFTNVALFDAGTYGVEIAGACGAVTNFARLIVNGPPSTLVNQTHCTGESVVFTTTTSGDGPFAFAWRKGDVLLPNETNSTLVLSNVTSDRAGSYFVEVTAPCGTFTNSASLTVLEPTSATGLADQEHCAGATVNLATLVSGSGPFSFIWRKNGTVMTGRTNSSIVLTNVSLADAAQYSVEVTGSCSSATNRATVIVITPAVITALTNLSICGVQNVLFAPVVSGNDVYTNLWRKDGAVLPGETNATLLISAATSTNAGVYSLEVYGSCGNTTNSAVLSIGTNAVVATLSNQTHCAGDTAIFAAEVSGEGPFAFTWKKDGEVISFATTSVLTLTNISPADSGLYTVEVIGGCDTAAASAMLTVNATVTATPLQSLNACFGQVAVFGTTAGGGSGPYYFVWRKDGVALASQTNSTLVLNNVTSTNVGIYSVEVTGCGRVTNFASLSVSSPVTATLPTNIVACVCDDLVLSPTVNGFGPFTCVWRKNGVVLAGETNSSLILTMLNTLSAGNYTLELYGPCNSVTNTTALQVISVTSGRWSNTNLLVIPQLGVASTYPSKILVQCAPKVVSQLQITLHGLSHAFPDDVDIMLVGPNGTAIKLLSDCGGSGANAISNVDLTFSADATAFLSDNAKIRTGTYRPTDYPNDIDPFQSPAPANANTTNISAFYGSNPNGYWSLFVVDDHGQDAGSLKGWTLDFGEEDFVLENVRLSSPEMLQGGAFQMELHGELNKTYYIEASSALTNWTIIQTNHLLGPSMTIIDYTAPQFDYRFYRATGCRE